MSEHTVKANSPRLGFIGQGWIGKHLADHFEERGFATIRYAKEPPYHLNRDQLADADIIFIAVPTPTISEKFDDRILRSVLPLVPRGKIAVVKSTILPGTTDQLAAEFREIFLLHAPEFLRETSVREDIDHPDRHILGIPSAHFDDPDWQKRAEEVLAILPPAPYQKICRASEAELTKYGGNNFLYTKVIFMNLLYDLAVKHGARWDVIAENMSADPRIGRSHMQPVHQYAHMGDTTGRGAGGHCFIKDFAALRGHIEELLPEAKETHTLLRAMEAYNNKLLRETKKDLELLRGVYGEQMLCFCRIHDRDAMCACGLSARAPTNE